MDGNYTTHSYFVPTESGKVYFNLRRLKQINRTTERDALVERIVLNDRVISLFARNGRLDMYSKLYSASNPRGRVIHFITKRLAPGIAPKDALERATDCILSGLAEIETESREKTTYKEVEDYLRFMPKTPKPAYDFSLLEGKSTKIAS